MEVLRNRSRYIVVHELGLLWLMVLPLFLILGAKIRYLKLATCLERDRFAIFLSLLGVNAFSYEDVQGATAKQYQLQAKYSGMLYGRHYRNGELERTLSKEFLMPEDCVEAFSLGCEYYLQSEFPEVCELVLFCRELLDSEPESKIYLIANPHPLCREIIQNEQYDGSNISLIQLPNLGVFKYLLIGFAKYTRALRNALTNNGNVGPSTKIVPSPHVTRFNQEVIYFPHKGVFFGSFFAKDHYYSIDSDSPFNARKILHLSIGDDTGELDRSFQYYRNHDIPYTDLHALTRPDIALWIRGFICLLWRNRAALLSDWRRCSPMHLGFFFARYCQLRFYLGCIAELPRAKIALVGYDGLFPPLLSVALSLRNIRTVATQERFVLPFIRMNKLIVDYYLPLGPRICRFIEDIPNLYLVKECTPIGPVRAEDILKRSDPGAFPAKYKDIKDKYFMILALDWHAAPTMVQNARTPDNNWKNIKRFYVDMIRLAFDLPQACIVIKGRSTVAMTLPAMADVMHLIDNCPNIFIETDLEGHPPALMAAMADFTIGCHTSLLDELWSLGRPALAYEFEKFVTNYCDYDGYPVIANSYGELLSRIRAYMRTGYFMDGQLFSAFRKDFYASDTLTPTPRQKLRVLLERIWLESQSATHTQVEP